MLKIDLNHVDNTDRSIDQTVFEPLVNLKNLYLYGNQLGGGELPSDIFHDLVNLEALDIGDNIITALPNDIFSPFSNLKLLNLNANRLTNISQNLFEGLQELEILTLYNNEFAAPNSIPPEAFLWPGEPADS